MRRHILGDAALLTSKGLVRGFGPALDPIKRFCRNFSKSLLSGLWTLGASCGVCAAPFAYIADRDGVAAGLSVIDTTSNSVVARIPVAARNVAISPDGSFVYAATSTGVAIISTATHGVVATVPVEPSMERVAMSPDGAFVYATGGQGYPGPGHVSVISTATRQVTATVPVQNAAVAIDVSPDGAFIYVTDTANLTVIATATNTVVASVFIGYDASNLAVTPDGAFVYVTRSVWDDISIFSTATRTLVGTVRSDGAGPFGNRSGPEGLAFSPDGAFLYVANYNAQNISKIDTATGSLVERIPSGGYGPSGVGVTPDGALLYVTNTRDDAVSVISISTRAVVANVKVGERPRAFGRFIGPLPPGTTLAVEGATFTVGASTVVRFGAGTRWTEKKVIGTATCSNAFFGADPAPGILKSCVVGAAATTPPTPGSSLASEGATFAVGAATLVRYGTTARWVEKTVTGTATCSNAFFSTDPAPGVLKSCVVGTATTAPPTPGSFLAVEDAAFSVSAATLVRYGTRTRWVEKTVTGPATCSNAFFGTDPAPYLLKSCVVGTPVTTPPTIGAILAYEDGTFVVNEPSVVIYGAGMGRVERTVNGTVNCSNAFFGIDPAPGVQKYCVFLSTASAFRQ
ncbi:MAG TPA: beta-propeller fold lactonase family protein [Variovorax sp.]|nr:beta-propeller fold lactonase family protein [Variovorax sp.]